MALKPYILVEFRTKHLVNLPFSICAICFDPKLQPCSALGKPFPGQSVWDMRVKQSVQNNTIVSGSMGMGMGWKGNTTEAGLQDFSGNIC